MTGKKIKHCIRESGIRLGLAGLSCLAALAVLEIVLRFSPVQSYIPYQPVTIDNPVARYQPHRSFVYSSQWNFQNINYGRTNAQGFVCDFDYNSAGRRPLIALLGDSYIEARIVPFSQTMQEKIRAALGDAARVYAFAMSGAPLSQYLIFAKMARDTYRPDMLVVNIVSNDFDESFSQYQSIPRFHYFTLDEHGTLQPRLQGSYRPSRLREMLSHSALVRYAYFHLRITDTPRTLRRLVRSLTDMTRSQKTPSTPAPLAIKSPKRLEISQKAVDAFLRLLPEYAGLPPGSIALVLDGQRLSLYQGTHKKDAFFELMRSYVRERAGRMGYEVLDMHPVFKRDYQAHGKRFEFEHDAHWNARAHELAAVTILQSRTLGRLFKHE
jgi:hypothetical protein